MKEKKRSYHHLFKEFVSLEQFLGVTIEGAPWNPANVKI